MIETLLFTHLKDDISLQAVVEDRIYPTLRPQGKPPPAIVFSVVGSSSVNSLDGDGGKDRLRMQFDCYAKSYEESKDLFALLRESLKNTTTFKSLFVGYNDGFEKDGKEFRTSADFSLF